MRDCTTMFYSSAFKEAVVHPILEISSPDRNLFCNYRQVSNQPTQEAWLSAAVASPILSLHARLHCSALLAGQSMTQLDRL